MAIKPLRERVEEAFAPDTARAFGDRYLEELLISWREVQAALRRTITLMVVLVVAFFLLIGARGTELSFGPFKLSDTETVLTLVPAIVSFLRYEFVVLQTANRRYEELQRALLRFLHPTIYENDLQYMLVPGTASLWGDHLWQNVRAVEHTGASSALQYGSAVVGGFFITTGSAVFLAYAYWRLLHHHSVGAAVWVSLAFAVFNVWRSWLTLRDEPMAAELG